MNQLINQNLTKLSVTQLTEYIASSHHQYVRTELKQIMIYLQEISPDQGEEYPEMQKMIKLFTAMHKVMARNMQDEELILFPRIKKIEDHILSGEKNEKENLADLKSTIKKLKDEHNWIEHLLVHVKQLTHNYNPPPGARTTYQLYLATLEIFEIDLRRHIHLEREIFFPKVLDLFRSRKVTA
jgi:regulator of cell morphogenesis and NO signaling